MLPRDLSFGPTTLACPLDRAADRRRCAAWLINAVASGASVVKEPRAARHRLEEALRAALQARSVVVRDDPMAAMPPPPNVVQIQVPFAAGDGRARIEAVFDGPRRVDDWTCQLIAAAAHVTAILLELERVNGRMLAAATRRQGDGAAPLIGSSAAIRRVRDRIERVAATDFTVLIEGSSLR